MVLMLQKLKDSTSLPPSLPASTSTDHTDDGPHDDMSEIQDAVRAHNKARTPRGCPLMQWDAELAAMAVEHARILASRDQVEEYSKVQGQGENIYVGVDERNYVDAVNVWLAEAEVYDGNRIGEGLGGFGRFTQCIWHNTTHLGMGKAKSRSGLTYIVARYTPPGNIVGEKPYGC